MILELLLLVFAIVLVYYYWTKDLNFFENTGILYNKPVPIFGNMAPVMLKRKSFAHLITEYYNNVPEGTKYFGLFDFSCPVIALRDLELIKSVAIKHFDNFVNHRGFVDEKMDPWFANNLFSLKDDQWKSVRTLLSPSFTSSKMKSMFKLMNKCSEDFAKFILKDAKANLRNGENGVVHDTYDIFCRYTTDVIATCAFGVTVDSMENPRNEFYSKGKRLAFFGDLKSLKLFAMRNFPLLSKFLGWRVVDDDVADFFKSVVDQTIKNRDKDGSIRPDMIQLMMDSRGKENVRHMSLNDMTAQAIVFFIGGFDTVATLMCFSLHEIAANPEVQAKLHEEIDEVMEKTNGQPSYEAIHGMKYMDAIISETLRLHPPATILDRVCNKSVELPPALPGGRPYTVKKGTTVWIPTCALQRDPKYFEDPDQFCPERFLDENLKNSPAYLPFGIGPRMCIGNRFALQEVKVMMFHLLANCILEPSKKTRIPLEYCKTVSLVPVGGFWLKFRARDKHIANGKHL